MTISEKLLATDKDEIRQEIKDGILIALENIVYCQGKDIESELDALEGLREATDVIENGLPADAHLFKSEVYSEGAGCGCCDGRQVDRYSVFLKRLPDDDAASALKLFSFEKTTSEERYGDDYTVMWTTEILKGPGLRQIRAAIKIQRWWKRRLRQNRAAIKIQRWWKEKMYSPDYYFKSKKGIASKKRFNKLKRLLLCGSNCC